MSELSIEERLRNLEQLVLQGSVKKPKNEAPIDQRRAGYALDLYTEGEEGSVVLSRFFYIDDFKTYSDGTLTFDALVPYDQHDKIGCIDVKAYPPVTPADETPLHYFTRLQKLDKFEVVTCRYEDYIKFFIRGHVVYTMQGQDATVKLYQPVARRTESENSSVVPMKRF